MTPHEASILRVLRRSSEPLSSRRVADVVGVAPNTALKVLRKLKAENLVSVEKAGRAQLWTTTADVAVLGEFDAPAEGRTVLVVTAVPMEFDEVRNRLVNAERVRVPGGLWLVKGEVPGKDINWTVFLAQSGMGNAPAAALVGVAAERLNANVVAFVGSAGGLKPGDQRHGDVVVASRIHNPYAGKQVVEDGVSTLLGRDKTYAVPGPLLSMVAASIADSAWSPTSGSEFFDPGHPHAFIAPIVAVDAVQTDPKSELMGQVRARFQDAAALDMESHGLAAGSDVHDLPVLVVRGLSDFLGDKADEGNDAEQPRSVGNAARLLLHILRFAHPGDFNRVAGNPPAVPPPATSGPVGEPASAPALSLPGGLRVWMDRLAGRSRERAEAAIESLLDMRRSGTSAATALSRFIHRPPSWLREDDTGDGWALVGHLAAMAGSKVSWRAFERAAEAAALVEDHGAEAYFRLTAALHRVIDDPARQRVPGRDAAEEFAALPERTAALVEPLVGFYLAAFGAEIDQNLPPVKEAAEVAMSWLGLNDHTGVLATRETNAAPHEFDSDIRDIVACNILQQLARMFLRPGSADEFGVSAGLSVRNSRGNPVVRDLADDSLQVARWAVTLRPSSESARLTAAQSLLGVLIAIVGRPTGGEQWDISDRVREVETNALQVRDVFREWNAESGPALAIAARARAMQGDPVGALNMLLAPPEGIATKEESEHPDVLRVASMLASATGREELALRLVSRDPDGGIEAALLRASIYGSRSARVSEAIDALLEALELSQGQVHLSFRALSGLIRLYKKLDGAQRGTVQAGLKDVAQVDPDLAELLQARVALEEGDAQRALEIVRGVEQTELALMTKADALVQLGQPADAWEALFDDGLRRSDVELLLAALDLAKAHDLRAEVRQSAQRILDRGASAGVSGRVLEALLNVERREQNWLEVLTLIKRIAEVSESSALPLAESLHWVRAEAQYFLGRFDDALESLTSAPAIKFDQREKVVLYLSVLKRALDDKRARDGSGKAYFNGEAFNLYLDAAREWAQDEQIAAMALAISMTSGEGEELSEEQLHQLKSYAELYFDMHGNEGSIQQVELGEDLENLRAYLKKTEERTEKLRELTQKVLQREVPLVLLSEAARKSYTEMLLRRDLGCYIAELDDEGFGTEAARQALNKCVAIDISSMVVGPLSGIGLAKLVAKFDSVLLADELRADIERARSSLALKSTGTLGWNSREERPYFSEIPEEQAQLFADAANELWAHVPRFRTARVVADDDLSWLCALQLARESDIPLWADDVSMRILARSLGLSTFSSLDLIRAFGSDDQVTAATEEMRKNFVVDLPIQRAWHALADEEDWNPAGPLAVAISRPYAWRNREQASIEFRNLIRLRPPHLDVQRVASWIHAAATGVVLATSASSRAKVAAALISWTAFEVDPFFSVERLVRRVSGVVPEESEESGVATRILLDVADVMREQLFPDADPIEPIVDTFSRVLRESLGSESTSQVMAELASLLGEPYGKKVFASYLLSAES